MAKEAVSEHSDEASPGVDSPGRDERTALDEEPSHERWSDPPAAVNAPGVQASSLDAPEVSTVSATSIVGVATTSKSNPPARPRFKTLMGVPRNDPNLDLYAGNPMLSAALLDSLVEDADGEAEAASARAALAADLALPARAEPADLALPSPAEPANLAEHALAEPADLMEPEEEPLEEVEATEITDENFAPGEPVFSPLRTDTTPLPRAYERDAPAHFFLDANASLDLSSELAALRSSSGGGPRWVVALAVLLAGVATFSVAAPREWERATRWLNRTGLSAAASFAPDWQQSAEALRPVLSNEAALAPAPYRVESAVAALPDVSAVTPVEPAAGSLAGSAPPTTSRPEASAVEASSTPADTSATTPNAASGTTTRTALRAVPAGIGSSATAAVQVAAARKPSVRPTPKDTRRAKPSAVYQNPSRKNVGSGIIRNTPF